LSYSAKDLVKVLRDHNFEFKRSKGSHHLFQNKESGKIVVVPFHGNRDLPKGTYFGILKQAGIDKDKIG
jgi:predicted RNA binding protein YcfA (HicA-like mRNA interferase family)